MTVLFSSQHLELFSKHTGTRMMYDRVVIS